MEKKTLDKRKIVVPISPYIATVTTPNNTRFNDDAEVYLRVAIDYAQAAVKKIERGAVVSDDAFEAILTIKELALDVYRCVARANE